MPNIAAIADSIARTQAVPPQHNIPSPGGHRGGSAIKYNDNGGELGEAIGLMTGALIGKRIKEKDDAKKKKQNEMTVIRESLGLEGSDSQIEGWLKAEGFDSEQVAHYMTQIKNKGWVDDKGQIKIPSQKELEAEAINRGTNYGAGKGAEQAAAESFPAQLGRKKTETQEMIPLKAQEQAAIVTAGGQAETAVLGAREEVLRLGQMETRRQQADIDLGANKKLADYQFKRSKELADYQSGKEVELERIRTNNVYNEEQIKLDRELVVQQAKDESPKSKAEVEYKKAQIKKRESEIDLNKKKIEKIEIEIAEKIAGSIDENEVRARINNSISQIKNTRPDLVDKKGRIRFVEDGSKEKESLEEIFKNNGVPYKWSNVEINYGKDKQQVAFVYGQDRVVESDKITEEDTRELTPEENFWLTKNDPEIQAAGITDEQIWAEIGAGGEPPKAKASTSARTTKPQKKESKAETSPLVGGPAGKAIKRVEDVTKKATESIKKGRKFLDTDAKTLY